MEKTFSLKRIGIAIAIAAGIYGVALGTGTLLYVTGAIGTGATHNTCSGFREEIADERGIDEEDVAQRDIERATEDCLNEPGHVLTEEEAYRSEYLFWSIWPGIICAVVFLVWPLWARILHNQEVAEEGTAGSHDAAAANVQSGT